MTIIKVCTKCNIYKPLDAFGLVVAGFFSRDGHHHVCKECNPKRLYDRDANGKLISYEEWPEERMDVIGQNGNTGEHYEGCTTKGLDK
jgi:hypothetical protein